MPLLGYFPIYPFQSPAISLFLLFSLGQKWKEETQLPRCVSEWVFVCISNKNKKHCPKLLSHTNCRMMFVCLFARMFNQKHWTMSCCLYISLCSDANQRKCKVPFAFGFQMKTYEWWRKQTRERERERERNGTKSSPIEVMFASHFTR